MFVYGNIHGLQSERYMEIDGPCLGQWPTVPVTKQKIQIKFVYQVKAKQTNTQAIAATAGVSLTWN